MTTINKHELRGRPTILQVCAVDYTAFQLLRPLLHACRDAGFNTEFASGDGPGAAALREEGFGYRHVAIPRSAAPIQYVSSIVDLAASLRRRPAEIVHTHTPLGGMVGRTAAVLARSPHVVHTFHGLAYIPGKMTLKEKVFLQLERVLARGTSRFFSQAQQDAADAVRLGIARDGHTTVIGNGIELTRFYPNEEDRRAVREELGIPEGAVVAITVARLIREKGLLDLAEAAARLRELQPLHFLLVGEALATDRDSVAAQLNEHPAAVRLGRRWRILGYRPDISRLLRAADFFVLPSYREGLPRSMIEAMASGLPVIASDIPAGRELVDPGSNGLLVRAGDVGGLVDAIKRISTNQVERLRLGHQARSMALTRYDERVVLDRQLTIFRQLLDRKRGS